MILLLISADFMASDYCYGKETTCALQRHEKGEARVIPVILRAVDWTGAPFGKLQALPKDAKPVVSWEDRDEAFTNIAQGIRATVSELTRSGRETATLDVTDLLKKFYLRPKKYAGKEFIADIELENTIRAANVTASECFDLELGDAIERRFSIAGWNQKNLPLFADSKAADWLEGAKSGRYRARIRLSFGAYFQNAYHPDEEAGFRTMTGYRFIEIIRDSNEQQLPDASTSSGDNPSKP